MILAIPLPRSGPYTPIFDPNPTDPNPGDPTDPSGGNPPTGCGPAPSCDNFSCPNHKPAYVDIDANQCLICKCPPSGPATPIISPY